MLSTDDLVEIMRFCRSDNREYQSRSVLAFSYDDSSSWLQCMTRRQYMQAEGSILIVSSWMSHDIAIMWGAPKPKPYLSAKDQAFWIRAFDVVQRLTSAQVNQYD